MPSQTPRVRRISIFDTTLRDGEQAPGNAMSPEEKLEMALIIEGLGVDVIETGMPSSSPSDARATSMIADALTRARISTLCRATRADVEVAAESGGTQRHHLQVMVTGSEVHLTHKRGIAADDAIAEAVDTITHAKSLGFEFVTVAVEDASRGSDGYLRQLIGRSVAAGADTVTLADTTGCHLPADFAALVRQVRCWVGPSIRLSTHCHEDLGLSLANAIAGMEAGADELQVCLAGIGERAGNTALEEVAAVLRYKGADLGVDCGLQTEKLHAAYVRLQQLLSLPAPRNKAVFGTNAFATQAGIHQAGMLRSPVTYESVEPAAFGRERVMLVGRHSGHAVLRHIADQLAIAVDDRLLDDIYTRHIANRTNGSCLTMTEVRDLIVEHAYEQLSA